jgi:hypothetical protein
MSLLVLPGVIGILLDCFLDKKSNKVGYLLVKGALTNSRLTILSPLAELLLFPIFRITLGDVAKVEDIVRMRNYGVLLAVRFAAFMGDITWRGGSSRFAGRVW